MNVSRVGQRVSVNLHTCYGVARRKDWGRAQRLPRPLNFLLPWRIRKTTAQPPYSRMTLTKAAFFLAEKAGRLENGLTWGIELLRVTPGLH